MSPKPDTARTEPAKDGQDQPGRPRILRIFPDGKLEDLLKSDEFRPDSYMTHQNWWMNQQKSGELLESVEEIVEWWRLEAQGPLTQQ
jgi:hypothetical protein